MAVETKPQSKPPATNYQGKIPGPPEDFLTECNNYLSSSGWTKLGTDESGITTWLDPISNVPQKSVRTLVGTLPNKNGEPINNYQQVGPPVPWTYGMNEAVGIQRLRDIAKAKTESKVA